MHTAIIWKYKKREDGYMHFISEAEENVSHWTNYIPETALFFDVDTIEKTVNAEFIIDEKQKLVENIINEETIHNDYGIGNRRFYPLNTRKES